jgi:CubicO group peptidase (beta-lactamase class C family)
MSGPLALLERAIEAGAMPGAVVCTFRSGEPLFHKALGTLDGEEPAYPEALYDLASLTKPIATAATLLTLIEDGTLALATPLPELLGPRAGHLKDITLRHLLTHTSGLPAWTACYALGEGLESAVEAVLREPAAPPGTKYEYSCLGYILLAKILQTVTEKPLDALAAERVFSPLRLESLTFWPDPTRCAPTVAREGLEGEPTLLRGVVHDGNARAIRAGGGVSGNAGLFGSALDVARFGEAIRTGLFFGDPTRRKILTPQSDPPGHTLMFFCPPNAYTPTGDLLSEKAVGHSGYTGTLLTIDPEHELTVALLTNAVYGEGKGEFLRWRRKFLNTIAAAL